jgi:hypothetical protein
VGSLYSPYRGLFHNSDAARQYRHLSTHFGRQPYRAPEEDSSIGDVQRNRTYNVGRIYHAMIRGDRAEDNSRSIAMKRWVTCAHYQPDVVEAFAHKVFDCLLIQVTKGFRGWHHNDYVDDDRKGEERDQQVDCAGRLDNIIDALEREKTICEDVMNSGSQIRMFVNAPIAYAARKYQNRVGNSKRGRATGADPNPRPAAKGRRTARSTRARSNTVASERVQSRDTTPHFLTSGAGAGPYYRTSLSQYQPATSNPTYSTPRLHPYTSLTSAPQDFGGYIPLTTTAATPMLRQSSATPQNLTGYAPIAATPMHHHPSTTPQDVPGYIPVTTATAQPLHPNIRPSSSASQPPTISRPAPSTSHQRRTYIPPTPPQATKFSTPQTTHVPTPPALAPTPRTTHAPTPPLQPTLYRQSYAAGPSHNVDYFSPSTAGNIWHGYAPATTSGAGGHVQDAFPDELLDPSLLGDGGGVSAVGNVGGDGEEGDDLFSQLIWAAGLQPGTPAAEEVVQQGTQQMPSGTVCLADIEDNGVGDAAFESFWSKQEGVQAFSFPDGEGVGKGDVKGEGSASASASAKVADAKGKGKRKRSDDADEAEVEGKGKRRRE